VEIVYIMVKGSLKIRSCGIGRKSSLKPVKSLLRGGTAKDTGIEQPTPAKPQM
jgi:hypothetical protein